MKSHFLCNKQLVKVNWFWCLIKIKIIKFFKCYTSCIDQIFLTCKSETWFIFLSILYSELLTYIQIVILKQCQIIHLIENWDGKVTHEMFHQGNYNNCIMQNMLFAFEYIYTLYWFSKSDSPLLLKVVRISLPLSPILNLFKLLSYIHDSKISLATHNLNCDLAVTMVACYAGY